MMSKNSIRRFFASRSYLKERDLLDESKFSTTGHSWMLSRGVKFLNDLSEELKSDSELSAFGEQPKPLSLNDYRAPLSRKQYSEITSNRLDGSIRQMAYKGSNLTLCSANFGALPPKNLFKILITARPDVLLLSLRPDSILKKIDFFSSEKEFISQIIREEGLDASPDREIVKIINEELGIGLQKRIPEFKLFKPYESLSRESLGVAAAFSSSKSIPVVLGGLPEEVFRRLVITKHTPLQLEQILKLSSRETIYTPDILPSTPWMTAFKLYPDIFQKPSDEYVATLLEVLISMGFKRITCLLEMGQTETVPLYLEPKPKRRLVDLLRVPEMEPSIISDVYVEEILERQTILDVMKYGEHILNQLEDGPNFKISYKEMEDGADLDRVDSTHYNRLRLLHVRLLSRYSQIVKKEKALAKEQLQKFFISKVLRK